MDVQLKSTTKVPLSSIKQGECFEHSENIYMLTDSGMVNLLSGYYSNRLFPNTQVRAVEMICKEV